MTVSSVPSIGPQLVRGLYPEVGTTGSLVGQSDILSTGLPASEANNPQFVGQVTIEEQHRDDMEIVTHPIEQGAPITDHAFKKPAECTLHIGWAGRQLIASGLISKTANGYEFQSQIAAIYAQLVQGQSNRVLYTVVTGKRQYSQMMIKSIDVTTDKEHENVLMVTLHMQQVIIAFTQVVAITAPPGAQRFASQTNPTVLLGRSQTGSAKNFNAANYSLIPK